MDLKCKECSKLLGISDFSEALMYVKICSCKKAYGDLCKDENGKRYKCGIKNGGCIFFVNSDCYQNSFCGHKVYLYNVDENPKELNIYDNNLCSLLNRLENAEKEIDSFKTRQKLMNKLLKNLKIRLIQKRL